MCFRIIFWSGAGSTNWFLENPHSFTIEWARIRENQSRHKSGIGFISTVCDWFIWINYKHLSGSKAPGLTSGRIESGTVQHKMDDELISWHGTDMSGRAVFFARMDQTDIKEPSFRFSRQRKVALSVYFTFGIWVIPFSIFFDCRYCWYKDIRTDILQIRINSSRCWHFTINSALFP